MKIKMQKSLWHNYNEFIYFLIISIIVVLMNYFVHINQKHFIFFHLDIEL